MITNFPKNFYKMAIFDQKMKKIVKHSETQYITETLLLLKKALKKVLALEFTKYLKKV